MIISKSVLIKTKYNMNLKYFVDLGYEISGNSFLVKVEHLLPNCKEIVDVSCDYCEVIESIKYIKYFRSLKSHIKKYCCKNCKGKKIKESNLQRYGVTNVAKLESSKDKSKKTNLEKYGVEYHTQSNITKNNIIKSNIEKYGVDNVLKVKYIQEKAKLTNLCKYGVDNVSKLEKIKDLKISTLLKNWGVTSPLKSDKIKDKVRKTNNLKYGNDFLPKSELYRKDNYIIAKNQFYISYIGNGISQFKCDLNQNHNFEITKDVFSKRTCYNIPLCTICYPVGENRSIKEDSLYKYIKSVYNGRIILNYRELKKEIDIYLPNLKIGFEFNGLYWHSSEFKESTFHINKSQYFESKGIRIYHIWEDDWDYKRSIIESQIKSWIGITNNRIYARNCHVKEIANCKIFLNENHIQGSDSSIIKIGLFDKSELISVMTFNKSEGRKKMDNNEWNLSRFCSKVNTTICGGASKMMSFFIKKYDPIRIVSYAQFDWSNGNLYQKLGFDLKYISKPDYKYILNSKRIHKSRFRKSNIGISEANLQIPKIWDCGKLKFELLRKPKTI
jgi:hypothetical protein